MKPRLLALLVVAALVAGYATWKLRVEEAQSPGTLTLYGNVDIRQVVLGFRVSGRVAAMQLEEGDRARTGDVLATLDREPYEHELALARADLDAQRATLEKLETGSRAEEIRLARAQVAEREAALDNVVEVYERQRALRERGLVSEQVFDDARAARAEADARLASARASLELALAGFRAEEVLTAAAQLRAAEARVAQAETRLADTALTAPSDGTVLTRSVEAGAIVAAGAPVYTLSLAAPVWVRTYVAEPQLGLVHPGMPAEILTDSGGRYAGQVGFISPDAEFTPKTVQTTELRTDLVYRVRVIVDADDQGLRRGMPVTVRLALPTAGGD